MKEIKFLLNKEIKNFIKNTTLKEFLEKANSRDSNKTELKTYILLKLIEKENNSKPINISKLFSIDYRKDFTDKQFYSIIGIVLLFNLILIILIWIRDFM